MYPSRNSSSTRARHSRPPGSKPMLIAALRTSTYGAGCPKICFRMCLNIPRASSLMSIPDHPEVWSAHPPAILRRQGLSVWLSLWPRLCRPAFPGLFQQLPPLVGDPEHRAVVGMNLLPRAQHLLGLFLLAL